VVAALVQEADDRALLEAAADGSERLCSDPDASHQGVTRRLGTLWPATLSELLRRCRLLLNG